MPNDQVKSVYTRQLSGKRTVLLKRKAVDGLSVRRYWLRRLRFWRRSPGLEPRTAGLECPPELDRSTLPAIASALAASSPGPTRWTEEPGARGPYGICLSGGGIRSASYCLGVLQELERHGMLRGHERADFLASVSGGSYIAGAFVMVNRGAFTKEPVDHSDRRQGTMPAVAPRSLAVFAPRSPEEGYLRDHIRYLTHGQGGIFGAIWRLFSGISWNVLILSLSIAAIALPSGWAYGALVPSLRDRCPEGCGAHHFAFPFWVFLVAIAAGAAALGVGMASVGRSWRKEGTRRTLLWVSLILLATGALWLLVVVALPLLLEWIRVSVGAHVAGRPVPPKNSTATIGDISGAGVLGSVLTAILGVRAARTAETLWDKLPAGTRTSLGGKAKNLLLKARKPLLNALAALIGPITITAVAVLFLHLGSLYRPLVEGTGGVVSFGLWLAGMALLGFMWLFGDLNAWSLNPFYRERLSAAFGLKRFLACDDVWSPTASTEDGRLVDATRRPYDFQYLISDAQDNQDFPDFLICAAANVSKYGATPTGLPVTSFVFSAADIGGPVIGAWPAATYEYVLNGMTTLRRNLTFQAAVSMSGAALSPEMGKMTRAPLRFLFTVLNIRLGLWIPNPNRLAEFEIRSTRKTGRRRLVPRLGYLFREMFGKNDPESKFLYITDGGHYENLGLVELLRRHCRYIWCVDASGEQQDSFSTIAGAIALAFSELDVRIDIDPANDMAPVPSVTKARAAQGLRPVVKRTFSVGTIHYSPDDPDDIGRLVIIKTGVPADAPQDVADFYENDSKAFPCDPTLDQLYTADRFDAYRSLGAFAANQAWVYCQHDFAHFLADGRPTPAFLP